MKAIAMTTKAIENLNKILEHFCVLRAIPLFTKKQEIAVVKKTWLFPLNRAPRTYALSKIQAIIYIYIYIYVKSIMLNHLKINGAGDSIV